jgi:outer membrane protein assembly factor BamE
MRNTIARNTLAALLAVSTLVLASGCNAIYKVDIYQGSLLEKKQVDQLKPGMSKRQVALLIGSPSIQDPFHQDRWDYLASVSKRGGETEVKNLVLHFDGDTLARVEGDYFPEQDAQLVKDLRKYGNLPREKNNRQGG